jgi:hypothetical protein
MKHCEDCDHPNTEICKDSPDGFGVLHPACERFKAKAEDKEVKETKGKKIKKGEEEKAIPRSTVRLNGVLYEQVRFENGFKYVFNKDSTFRYTDKVYNNLLDVDFVPCLDEEVLKGAVLFPHEPKHYEDIKTLIKSIEAFIFKWLDIPDIDRKFYTYYILQTWIYEVFHTIGYARALGDTGTGKTRFLDVIGGLCYKPIFTNGAIGAAPVFRIMDKHRGTLVIDEANFGKTDETQAIMAILNSGWEQGKPVLRCDKEHPERINTFDPFGPKVLGTRKKFTDSALEARCYTVTVTQTDREDIPANLDERFFAERDELSSELLAFRLKNIDKIKYNPDLQKEFAGIEPRVIQKALPLASIVQDDKEALTEFIKYVNESQEDLIDERQSSSEGKVALAILDLYELHLLAGDELESILISGEDIAAKMNETLPEKRKTNSQRVGKMLKVLGFTRTQKQVWVNEAGHTVSSDKNDNSSANTKKTRILKRALDTDSKLLSKMLRRYTFSGDEKYPLVSKAVSSVSSPMESTKNIKNSPKMSQNDPKNEFLTDSETFDTLDTLDTKPSRILDDAVKFLKESFDHKYHNVNGELPKVTEIMINALTTEFEELDSSPEIATKLVNDYQKARGMVRA